MYTQNQSILPTRVSRAASWVIEAASQTRFGAPRCSFIGKMGDTATLSSVGSFGYINGSDWRFGLILGFFGQYFESCEQPTCVRVCRAQDNQIHFSNGGIGRTPPRCVKAQSKPFPTETGLPFE
jgi:hypothetical protein